MNEATDIFHVLAVFKDVDKCYYRNDEAKQFYTADTFYWGSSS